MHEQNELLANAIWISDPSTSGIIAEIFGIQSADVREFIDRVDDRVWMEYEKFILQEEKRMAILGAARRDPRIRKRDTLIEALSKAGWTYRELREMFTKSSQSTFVLAVDRSRLIKELFQ